MPGSAKELQRRYHSARRRIAALSSLREVLALPKDRDLQPRQWKVIASQLAVREEQLAHRLKSAARAFLPLVHEPVSARRLNAALGALEFDLTQAFGFFDTYMDVLTQRHAPQVGRLLAGCDVLAWECIHRDHPALLIVEPPLVYCDRGFGASTLREGVKLRDGVPNPLPLIQIPYSRLSEKCNLTSIYHEVGHEAMVRLGLIRSMPRAFRAALARAGAPGFVQDFYALWSFEIGPDYWAFGTSGLAAAGAIREILALPPSEVFRISAGDPHPPPDLRARLLTECCRQLWGAGIWDEWERNWQELYPPSAAPPGSRGPLRQCREWIPLIARALRTTRYRVLGGRTIPDLFDLGALHPARLRAPAAAHDSPEFRALSPAAQLAVFRLIKERGSLSENELDRVMTGWLSRLASNRSIAPRAAVSIEEALEHA